jgi:hypothetical protein
MIEDALTVLRSLIFFAGLVVANIYILMNRKLNSAAFSGERTEISSP